MALPILIQEARQKISISPAAWQSAMFTLLATFVGVMFVIFLVDIFMQSSKDQQVNCVAAYGINATYLHQKTEKDGKSTYESKCKVQTGDKEEVKDYINREELIKRQAEKDGQKS